MVSQNFDRLARAISTRLPRRSLAGLLGLGAAGLSTLGWSELTDARKKKNKKKKKKSKKKVELNDFECVDVGNFCKNDSQCCSGVCEGKKDNKKCKAHDESTCQANQDACLGVPQPCTTTIGGAGQCVKTTGKASYCFDDGICFSCSKDTDCVAVAGVGAACVVCVAGCAGENPQGTACMGLGELV